MTKIIKVRCPKCKEEFSYYDSKFRPFCSERCKEVDLGQWFSENYRVPSRERLSDDDLDKIIEETEKGNHDLEN